MNPVEKSNEAGRIQKPKRIDAGHGGGQVLRTALSLAALTGTPIDIRNIRQNRPKPGLQPQHLACVHAVAKITGGNLEHDAIGSPHVVFRPGKVQAGHYEFNIGTAGSCTLLLQCILPPLLSAENPSAVRIIGGTDVPFSPTSLFLKNVFAPALEKMGATVVLTVTRHGFYPKGGGIMDAIVQPLKKPTPIKLDHRAPRGKVTAYVQSSQLPNHVAEREKAQLQSGLDGIEVLSQNVPAANAGNAVLIHADYGGFANGFDALGKIGKSAESVAQDAIDAFQRFDQSPDVIEPHLLDQMLLYAALVAAQDEKGNQSTFKVSALSEHAISNLQVIHELLGTTNRFSDGILTIQG